MFQNYIKTALRHLSHHKFYLLLNVAGLGIGLALCVVAYLFWKFDADFDKFHVHADKIFRVTTIKSGTQQMYGVCPAPIAELAKSDLAGVKDAVVLDNRTLVVNKGDKTFSETVLFSEPSFLNYFTFPLAEGSAELDNPATVLVSEQIAKKYFATENPIGQTLTFYAGELNQRDLLISGVFKDHPLNSSIYFDFVTHLSNLSTADGSPPLSTDWRVWRDAVFLVLEEPTIAPQLLPQLNRYVSAHQAARSDFNTQEFFLEPLNTIAHQAHELRWNALQGSLPPYSIWTSIVMAILLLLTACLNFANTTIALAQSRLKEIGVRKVMGGNQRQLIQQLLGESFVVCLMALCFGLALADWVVEIYSRQWSFLDLELAILDNPPLIGFLIGTVVLTTLMAGAYPAFYISSFNPNRIFHGAIKFGGSNLVSRVLVGLQVSISLIALIAGFTFASNAHFQQTADLGYERGGVQVVSIDSEETFGILKNEMQKNPMVVATAGVHSHMGDSCPRIDCSIKGEKHEVEYMTIGEDYLELMNIQILEGRPFNYQMETDFETAIMVNQKFANDFFPNDNPIGQKVTFFETLHCTIVGVVGNFMQDSFHDPLRPLALKLGKPDRFEYLVLKTETKDMLKVRAALKSVWQTYFPMRPFEHFFSNDFHASSIKLTHNLKWFMLIIAVVTLLLTVTGLYALISLNVLKRLKEIAIRRVLGASSNQISFLLNKNYLWILSGGILLGCLSGGWFSYKMLNSIYNIHAGISGLILMLATVCAIVVVFGTVGIKTRQVMQGNPAEILKKN